MTEQFTGMDLINMAIDIEKTGIAFYDIMCTSSENEEARTAFRYLADMERRHERVFEEMLGKAGQFQSANPYGAERAAYIRSLVDSAVFSEELLNSTMANRVSSDVDALELAIGAEKDSLLFYYEMRDHVPETDQQTVDTIIEEERGHLNQILELKKKLAVMNQ